MIRNVRTVSDSPMSSTLSVPWAVRYLPVPPVIASSKSKGPSVMVPSDRDDRPGVKRVSEPRYLDAAEVEIAAMFRSITSRLTA
jgi:hypothetical protein